MNSLLHIRHPFNTRTALWIAIISGIILTGIMTLAHLNEGWVVDEDFHLALSLPLNILLLFVLLLYNFALIKSSAKIYQKYLFCALGSVVIAVAFSLLSWLLHRWIYDVLQVPDNISINIIKDIIIALVAITLSIVLFSLTRRQQMTLEKEQLQRELLSARYEALENQLDPHFLFNSLNTLSGLIGQDDEKARQYLLQLASNYRYIMRGQKNTTLEEEIRFADSYCQMMQIRYGDNLSIVKRIDSQYLNYSIVPISIQLLVENAIKHNVISDRHPLTVTIETTPDATLRVSNILQPKQESSQGNGLGLANLDKRCELYCGRKISISNGNNTFSVEIPLMKSKQ